MSGSRLNWAARSGKRLENPPADTDGYWIDRSNHYLGFHIRHCGWNSDAVIRLFRRECRYETRWVHEEIDLPSSRLDALKNPMLHYTTWDSDQYLLKMNRYAGWGALDMRNAGRQPSLLAMVTRTPLRFFQLYFLRLGFLDGIPGFHICMHTAYYSFLKQAKLWELIHALPQPDVETGDASQPDVRPILPFQKEGSHATERRPRPKAAASSLNPAVRTSASWRCRIARLSKKTHCTFAASRNWPPGAPYRSRRHLDLQ